MKRISLLLLSAALCVAALPSCGTGPDGSRKPFPISVFYTGAGAGHEFTAGYSTTNGATAVVKQK